jgi:hypothetical protein
MSSQGDSASTDSPPSLSEIKAKIGLAFGDPIAMNGGDGRRSSELSRNGGDSSQHGNEDKIQREELAVEGRQKCFAHSALILGAY